MSYGPKQQLTETYDLEEAALAGATTAEADAIRDALARAEHLADRAPSTANDLYGQAVEDTAAKLAELEAKHDADLAASVPGLEEDAALQAALADAEEDLESDDEEDETAELSDAEREEKQELEAKLADLEGRDNDLAAEEAKRVERELAELTE